MIHLTCLGLYLDKLESSSARHTTVVRGCGPSAVASFCRAGPSQKLVSEVLDKLRLLSHNAKAMKQKGTPDGGALFCVCWEAGMEQEVLRRTVVIRRGRPRWAEPHRQRLEARAQARRDARAAQKVLNGIVAKMRGGGR